MAERLKVTDGYEPFVSVLHRVVLPPRGTKRANLQRLISAWWRGRKAEKKDEEKSK